MKNLLLLSIMSLLTVRMIAQNIQPIAIGTSIPLPDTKMKSIDGKEYSIKGVAAKNGVFVMFSCNTCPIVKKYQSRTLQATTKAKEEGFGVIIINSNDAGRENGGDSYSAMQRYAKAQQYNNVAYVLDENSAIANSLGATRTPECFLFNTAGNLVYHGAIDDNPNDADTKNTYLAKAIAETAQGKNIEVKETRSVGCMIKRS